MNTSINEIPSINIPLDNLKAATTNQNQISQKEVVDHLTSILQILNNSKSSVPKTLINILIECKEESAQLFLELIEYKIDNFQKINIANDIDHIIMLFILAKFKEQKAFPYIIKIAGLYRDWPEKILGDMINEGLASLLVSTYNGDLQAIKNIIENQYADIWCRIACLNSMRGLFAIGILTRQELIDYYAYLLQTQLIEDGEFVIFLVRNINSMYPAELFDTIEPLLEKEYFDTSFIDKEYIEKTLSLGIDECLRQHVYSDKYISPIDNVIEDVEWLYRPEENEDQSQPTVKIGRNDPCPCDSGKKYKKCCL